MQWFSGNAAVKTAAPPRPRSGGAGAGGEGSIHFCLPRVRLFKQISQQKLRKFGPSSAIISRVSI